MARKAVRAAKGRHSVAQWQVLDSGELIGLRAAIAYVNVASDRQVVALADENVRRHRAVVDQIQTQVDAGGGSTADLDQARGRLALAEATRAQLIARLRDSEATYIESVGVPADELTLPQPDGAAVPADRESALARALETNPALLAARANIEAVEGERDATDAPFLPRVDLELSAARNENVGGIEGPNNDVAAGVVFTYNFYRGGADTARRRAAAALASEAQSRFVETRRLVEQNARLSFNAYEAVRDRLPSLALYVESTNSALNAYYQQFSLGRRTLLDLLNVEGEVFQARTTFVDGEAALLVAQYQVLAAVGDLLSTLGAPVVDSTE